jgi:hypothetical protein
MQGGTCTAFGTTSNVPRLVTFSITAYTASTSTRQSPQHASCSHPEVRSSVMVPNRSVSRASSTRHVRDWTKMEQQYGGALYTRRPGPIETATPSNRHTCSAPVRRPAAHKPGERYVPVPCQLSEIVQRALVSTLRCVHLLPPSSGSTCQALSWMNPQARRWVCVGKVICRSKWLPALCLLHGPPAIPAIEAQHAPSSHYWSAEAPSLTDR